MARHRGIVILNTVAIFTKRKTRSDVAQKTESKKFQSPADEAPRLFHGIIPNELNNVFKGQHTVERLVTAGCSLRASSSFTLTYLVHFELNRSPK